MPTPGGHARQTTAKGVHTPYRWTFANAASRIAFTPDEGLPSDSDGLTAEDLHCKALQLDDHSEWLLIDIDPVTWQGAAAGANTKPSTEDKELPALATTGDGDPAIASAVTGVPVAGGYVGVRVNGQHVSVGDGTKVSVDCYFSDDGGTTAKDFDDIATGDVLYWNGSVAGYQLATTDRISLDYEE